MNWLALLDTGPLGLATNPRVSERSRACNAWMLGLLEAGVRVVVPAICDYEHRRELHRAKRVSGLKRLDDLAEQIGYLPIDAAVLRLAAELWAEVRNAGKPTAPDTALDGDVILAAQARLASGDGQGAVVATENVGHLGRFVPAVSWEQLDLEFLASLGATGGDPGVN